MSDFLRGVGTGFAGSNGIARAVNNFAMAPYIAAIKEQRARSDAAVQALNEEKLAEINRRQTANHYWAGQLGVPAEALGGYTPTEISQQHSNIRERQMMVAAGMLGGGQPSGEGLAEAKARSEANIQRNAELLKRLTQDSGAIKNAVEGRGMYQYQNNGAAFNPFYGTSEVSDQEVRNLYAQKEHSEIARRQLRTEPYQQAPKQFHKPLPALALKMQQEEMDAIGASASLSADLDAIDRQIETGALDLGMVSNFINRGRNFAGLSSEQSRNLASLEANLERLRNESLRLNKGVQTEGDSQRAWNEMVKNLNDPNVVRKRLREIININRRAIEIRKNNLDAIRSNYGLPPMQIDGIENVKPSVVDNVLTPGSIEDGYEYLGGDPSQPTSWRKR